MKFRLIPLILVISLISATIGYNLHDSTVLPDRQIIMDRKLWTVGWYKAIQYNSDIYDQINIQRGTNMLYMILVHE